nr:hypothetical protein BaRGS_023298 [Batillaria attramentaria]
MNSSVNSSLPLTSDSPSQESPHLDYNDYEYDYEDSVNSVPVNELVVNAVGYGLVLLLGLTGNILVVVSVARYRRMHNVTNIFLLSLATADLLLVCICVPVKGERNMIRE